MVHEADRTPGGRTASTRRGRSGRTRAVIGGVVGAAALAVGAVAGVPTSASAPADDVGLIRPAMVAAGEVTFSQTGDEWGPTTSRSSSSISVSSSGGSNTSFYPSSGDEWEFDINGQEFEFDSSSFADSEFANRKAQAVTLKSLSKDVNETYRGSAYTGKGVDVAVIDTGVAPVSGLKGENVLHGPDLSMEGDSPAAHLDTYGHGTHIAAIIAGNRKGHHGIAPGARVVSVKVAGHDGATTIPQVVAAIDWVVEHKDRDGLNIRILNLSLGQGGVSDHQGDILSAAVERAWDAGIFVVVAAGNKGYDPGHLDSPAIDPYVMAVAGVDSMDYALDERFQPAAEWSSRGDGARNPDIAAPGRSIASYRVPGSTIDEAAPGARHGSKLFKGSGTSQSAAVISGVAARMLEHRPELTNDELKATFTHGADTLVEWSNPRAVGSGTVDIDNTKPSPQYGATQNHPRAAGAGTGLVEPSGGTWSGGTWSGGTWSGGTWSGATWSGATWSGATWSGGTWSGATWSGATWSGATWSGNGWK